MATKKRIRNNFTRFHRQVMLSDNNRDDGVNNEIVNAMVTTLDALHHMYGTKALLGAVAYTLDGNGVCREDIECSIRIMGMATRYPGWRTAFSDEMEERRKRLAKKR